MYKSAAKSHGIFTKKFTQKFYLKNNSFPSKIFHRKI